MSFTVSLQATAGPPCFTVIKQAANHRPKLLFIHHVKPTEKNEYKGVCLPFSLSQYVDLYLPLTVLKCNNSPRE